MITISSRMPPLSSETIINYRAFHGNDNVFDYVVGMHYHEHYEIFLHRSGGTNLAVGQTTYAMSPGDLYIIPPFSIHGVLTEDALHNYERLWIHITPEYLSLLGANIIDFRKRLEHRIKSGYYRVPLSAGDCDMFCSLIDDLNTQRSEGTPYSKMKSHLLLATFFNELSRVLELDTVPDTQYGGNPVIQQVFNYIAENCTEDLSLDSLALKFNISKYYLSHMFTKVYNVSVYRYILMCRIAMAQRLIVRNENLNDVAQSCGFNDYSNFLRAFVQITGNTPSKYRKRITEGET